MDASPPMHGLPGHEKLRPEWRHCIGFAEVKLSRADSPQAKSDNVVNWTTQQAADYARLHMSVRPFQLFLVGLFVTGLKFCVAIFDREGVTF